MTFIFKMKIDPFKISYPKQRILEIKEKVEIFPWHEMPKEGAGLLEQI